jgi:hypothetical protein
MFEKWGKPGSMRVDNGEPLGSPSTDTTPVLALWCISQDIDMIWNKPHTPQLNGVVEHMQDTTQRWAEIDKALNINDLQERLDREAIMQREIFKVSRLDFKTRLETYPELLTGQRPWMPNAENRFDMQRVFNFIEKKIYSRKVSDAGQIGIFAQKLSVGKKYAGQYVQVKLDAQNQKWKILHNYDVVNTKPCTIFTKQNIESLNLSVMSKNNSGGT